MLIGIKFVLKEQVVVKTLFPGQRENVFWLDAFVNFSFSKAIFAPKDRQKLEKKRKNRFASSRRL